QRLQLLVPRRAPYRQRRDHPHLRPEGALRPPRRLRPAGGAPGGDRMTAFNRLPAPMGLLIDRERPLAFSFDGKNYQGLQGDSIASALLANGRWLMSRSFKYHRPRGPLSLAGQDANTLVQLP